MDFILKRRKGMTWIGVFICSITLSPMDTFFRKRAVHELEGCVLQLVSPFLCIR